MNEQILTPLSDCTLQSLSQWLAEKKQPSFRARQILEWQYKHLADDFSQMVNLPKVLREELSASFAASALEIIDIQKDDGDGTTKWLSRLLDGNTVETVLIPAPDRNTVCISTQVGCAVRCAFCASGRHGFIRNLSAGEIIDQVRLAARNCTRVPLTNIVVMGIGEPMHNRANLVSALNTICDQENGMGMGARHITISTSGIVPEMLALAEEAKPWNLAISLHAVDDFMRAKIIPPQNRYPMEDILDAARKYRQATNRMVTIEYALCKGINDSADTARKLAEIALSIRAKVNLIPCNNQTGTFLPPPVPACREFLNILLAANVQATLRLRKGDSIKAACGQLRARHAEQ